MALQNKRPIIAEERRHRVLQLKMAGFSDQQITLQVGVSKGQVRKDWKKRLGELAREDLHAATVIRTLAMLRYEALFLRWWQKAIDPQVDTDTARAAGEMILKVLRAEREINGLDPIEPVIVNVDNREQILNLTAPLAKASAMIQLLQDKGYVLNGQVAPSPDGAISGDGLPQSIYPPGADDQAGPISPV